MSSDGAPLLSPERLWAPREILARPSPVPAAAGVYAWYFDEAPPGLPLDACWKVAGSALLYVGISPRRPAADGRASSQTLRSRLRGHLAGNASGSTLRLSLGCLLSSTLGLKLGPTTSGRLTFGDGEAVLSDWMAEHARVCWLTDATPWVVEDDLIAGLDLPLNLRGNEQHPFYDTLSAARASARRAAQVVRSNRILGWALRHCEETTTV